MATDFKLTWNEDDFMVLATKENMKAMKVAAITVQRTMKVFTGQQGTGPTKYKRGKNRWHRASSPYQPPARDTGVLTSSLGHEVTRKGLFISGAAGIDTSKIRRGLSSKGELASPDYPLFLETGHTNRGGRSSTLPRPWALPALKRNSRKIVEIFQKANS